MRPEAWTDRQKPIRYRAEPSRIHQERRWPLVVFPRTVDTAVVAEIVYDRIGTGYAQRRRPDPRWETALNDVLGQPRGS